MTVQELLIEYFSNGKCLNCGEQVEWCDGYVDVFCIKCRNKISKENPWLDKLWNTEFDINNLIKELSEDYRRIGIGDNVRKIDEEEIEKDFTKQYMNETRSFYENSME